MVLFDYDDRFQSSTVSLFPRRGHPYLALIAPLWADFNFRDYGTIFYRLATDNRTLEFVADVLTFERTIPNYLQFRPTLAVVITWFQSRPLGSQDEVSLCLAIYILTMQG